MFSNDGDHGSNAQSNGGVSRGRRDREFRARHSSSNRRPRRDGGGAVGTSSVILGENDTLRGGGEQDEQSDIEEDRNDSSDELSDELNLRFGTKEVASLKVAGHIRSLTSGSRANDASGQVECLIGGSIQTSELPDTTENKLGALGDSGYWVDVGVPGTLNADKGEEEANGESK